MRKSQEKEREFKGEITAFLALIFILILSLTGALLESASIQITRSRKRADTLLALESVFAQYQKELLENYDIFGYQSQSKGELFSKLSYYGAKNMSHSIEKVEYLTDENGAPFYRQAVAYGKSILGISEAPLEELELGFQAEDEDKDAEEDVVRELETLLEQEEAELPTENNPIVAMETLKQTGLLTLVMPKDKVVSERSLVADSLSSARTLQKGNYSIAYEGGVADRVFFLAYLTEHFGNATKEKETESLLYEQEYLLAGQDTDAKNLESVCKKILNIRMAANYVYLLTDAQKQAEAEAMAAALCSLLTVPAITQLAKHAILLAWAYGESIVDVRVLLQGKRVPAVKTADTWQLQLSSVVKMGTPEEDVKECDVSKGLSYSDYVRGFLLLTEETVLSMRSLDLMESNLGIKADSCITRLQLKSTQYMRRGIRNTFTTEFGYQ